MRKIRHVNNNVATVMPEMGLEEEPISPVSRDETATKRKKGGFHTFRFLLVILFSLCVGKKNRPVFTL